MVFFLTDETSVINTYLKIFSCKYSEPLIFTRDILHDTFIGILNYKLH